jgi:hypothetical protein
MKADGRLLQGRSLHRLQLPSHPQSLRSPLTQEKDSILTFTRIPEASFPTLMKASPVQRDLRLTTTDNLLSCRIISTREAMLLFLLPILCIHRKVLFRLLLWLNRNHNNLQTLQMRLRRQ